jgi:sigma-54 dependent transcriptional regulator, acetoin dehydrogenase operon transcriptional activator AcoR
MQKRILFIDQYHDLSRIAEQAVKSVMNGSVFPYSAGVQPQRRFSGLDDESGTVDYKSLSSIRFDCAVTIGTLAADRFAMLPGLPPVVRWDDLDAVDEAAYHHLKAVVWQRTRDLTESNCLSALFHSRSSFEHVVDSLQVGVIAHDLNRKIFLFSKGAERITGIPAAKILGRDCHDLFTPRLCGASCAFCEGGTSDGDIAATYTARFLSEEGCDRVLDVTRVPLADGSGTTIGALATFTDTTRIHELERRLHETQSFAGIIGSDDRMVALYDLIRDCADSDFPVVITGESGTGKELVAAAIHNESLRRDHLFVPVNCGALPEGMLESELFGHLKGAFTGAIREKKGRFELAHKGTIFLDEIGDLSLSMQVKLLRVLQEGVFEPLGSETSRKVDVRLICATNRNLKEMVAKSVFRDDLYYRIAVVPIEMPPLRERRNDIVLLARYFLKKTCERLSRGNVVFSGDTLSVLMNYSWPGNVRQLQNAIQFAMIKCKTGEVLPMHLPPEILVGSYVPVETRHSPGKAGRKQKLTSDIVQRALEKTGGNKAKAARLLAVGRATLYNFINSEMEKCEVCSEMGEI